MVDVETGDSIVVTLERAGEFTFFDVDELDFGVRAADGEAFGGLVECKRVGYDIAGVDGEELLDHSDVP